jgi:hypothetical protein
MVGVAIVSRAGDFKVAGPEEHGLPNRQNHTLFQEEWVKIMFPWQAQQEQSNRLIGVKWKTGTMD